MRGRQDIWRPRLGYCLAELLVTISLVGLSLLIAALSVTRGIERQEARGVAQVAQAAVARAQAEAIWGGGQAQVSLAGGRVSVGGGHDGGNDDLGLVAPKAVVSTNVIRWQTATGLLCRFLAPFGCPDSGGSITITGGGARYKITVRPESGLTVRSWSAQ